MTEKEVRGPSVTVEDIEANIVGEIYITPSDYDLGCAFRVGNFSDAKIKMHTFCILTLKNGFTVVGVNEGPVSPENYKPELGRKFAREHAVEKIWVLLGYQLKEQLFIEQQK